MTQSDLDKIPLLTWADFAWLWRWLRRYIINPERLVSLWPLWLAVGAAIGRQLVRRVFLSTVFFENYEYSSSLF